MKPNLSIISVAIIFLFSGCMTTIVKKVEDASKLEYLKQMTVENIDLDYEIECKVKIVSETLNRSSKCGIIINKNNQLKFSIYHPMGGVMIISYMDAKKIQYLNRTEKVFYQTENNPKNRKTMFMKVADLNVADFKEILWGRKITSLDNNIEFIRTDQSVKAGNGKGIEVIYHKWQTVQQIQLPKLITIRNQINGSYIKIVVTKSFIGEISNDKELSLLEKCTINF
ncbi:MAG: hypothetical protein HOD92_03705 [Deltaproteobacteria bacterium]|jgi:hypothetical protein|nr:hypothetical protein [Deltaproteobacteria bacterium]